MTSIARSLFHPGIPVVEKVVRTMIVYLAILLLLRLLGKRTAAQMNAFDLVVLLLLSNVVQNAIIGADNSLVGGVVGAIALVLVNEGVVRIVRRSGRLDEATEGTQARLVDDGAFVDGELRRLGIRRNDLEVALRRQGAEDVGQVRSAELYPSGALVVDMRMDARDASAGDVERLERKLDEVLSALARLSAPPA
jgi:uncharacterized membrane protein YcaP (DUF421 family)